MSNQNRLSPLAGAVALLFGLATLAFVTATPIAAQLNLPPPPPPKPLCYNVANHAGTKVPGERKVEAGKIVHGCPDDSVKTPSGCYTCVDDLTIDKPHHWCHASCGTAHWDFTKKKCCK
jgi:hypothetical protein